VEHVCGDPGLSEEKDHELMTRIVMTGLRALQTAVTKPTLFEPTDMPTKEAVHAS
jgi:hypothetical protein